MSTRIEDMRNLGPATARMLAEIDICNEAELRACGASEAYHRLKFRFGKSVSMNALYAMEAALRGCDWRELDDETRRMLREQAAALPAPPPRFTGTASRRAGKSRR